jgi:CO dehydrogenase nickel-insertion accessory protein CooC1
MRKGSGNDVEGALAGKRVGMFGKGGSGKTTITILLARAIRSMGYEVCVVDADSSNLGIHAAMGLDEAPKELIGHFGGMVFNGGAVTCPVDDPTPLPGAELRLEEIPPSVAARSAEGIFLLVLGKMGAMGVGAGCDGPIAKIARDLRLRSGDEEPVTLIDFKAGFEDSARGAITSLDWVVVVVDPTNTSVRIAGDMRRIVNDLGANGTIPATRHLGDPALVAYVNELYANARTRGLSCILNKVTSDDTEQYLRRRLMEVEIEPIGVMHNHPGIAASWLTGTGVDAGDQRDEITTIVRTLEREIVDSGVPQSG